MKNILALFVFILAFSITSCQRPVAYFQHTPHAATRLSIAEHPVVSSDTTQHTNPEQLTTFEDSTAVGPVVATLNNTPSSTRIERRMHRVQSMLPAISNQIDKQPQPKPKPKKELRLGNRIRETLGMPLRKELNWWQRISWKLKASVIVVLIAVLFAILHITILAIIFGVVGAFLLITGLKRSMKVRRPWF